MFCRAEPHRFAEKERLGLLVLAAMMGTDPILFGSPPSLLKS
jgi:hypothetical protein